MTFSELAALALVPPLTCCSSSLDVQLAMGVMGAVLVFVWLLTSSLILNNLLGASLCIAFVSLVRLPNVKARTSRTPSCPRTPSCTFL